MQFLERLIKIANHQLNDLVKALKLLEQQHQQLQNQLYTLEIAKQREVTNYANSLYAVVLPNYLAQYHIVRSQYLAQIQQNEAQMQELRQQNQEKFAEIKRFERILEQHLAAVAHKQKLTEYNLQDEMYLSRLNQID